MSSTSVSCTVLYCLHCTVLYCTVMYCTVCTVLTVDVQHERVLDGLQRHGGVEGLAPQRAPVILNTRPVLEQRHVLLLQPGLRYTETPWPTQQLQCNNMSCCLFLIRNWPPDGATKHIASATVTHQRLK